MGIFCRYRKVLICAPRNITFTGFVEGALISCGAQVHVFDAVLSTKSLTRFIYHKTLGLNWLNRLVKVRLVEEVNKNFCDLITDKSFDLIIIYNSEYISQTSLAQAKSQGITLVNYLGDNPFYTAIYDDAILGLKYFDYILSPDRFWIKCLEMLSLKAELAFMLPGANPAFTNLNAAVKSRVVFVGSNYTNKEGFKRASLFNSIVDVIDIYGNRSWLRWWPLFENLEGVYFESPRLSDHDLNVLINEYKLAVVDANTGIVAGIHQRLLDISQTGCLPLVEMRYELSEEFGDFEIFFGTPHELRNLIYCYLGDEKLRLHTLIRLSERVRERFNVEKFIQCIN